MSRRKRMGKASRVVKAFREALVTLFGSRKQKQVS